MFLKLRSNLTAQIGAAVCLGVLAGLLFGRNVAFLGELGTLLIRLLKTLATPLIFFAIVNAICTTHIDRKSGLRLLFISGTNAVVACLIALGVFAVFSLTETATHLNSTEWLTLSGGTSSGLPKTTVEAPSEALHFDPIKILSGFIPQNALEPLITNNVIAIVLFSLFIGIAIRRLRNTLTDTQGLQSIEKLLHGGQQITSELLTIVVKGVPLAVFGVIAKVVGTSGLGIFSVLGIFVALVAAGIVLHCFVYYSILIFFVARKSPLQFFKDSKAVLMTALGTGSSLATLPVTLNTLQKEMKISPESSMLAACVGTNLNHDGILLYEAVAALFIAQIHGISLTIQQKIILLGSSALAAVGIAGVPDAGLITLSLVLSSTGLPLTLVPLLMTVDWFIGRMRAMTNVTSDLIVANLLEKFKN